MIKGEVINATSGTVVSGKYCQTPCQMPKGQVSDVTILLPNSIVANSTLEYEFVFTNASSITGNVTVT
jgi:hypothetical protein